MTTNIKSYSNWCVWDKKNQPRSAVTGECRGWNENLCDYDRAVKYCEENPGFRVGFRFSKSSPFIGLDFDSCINPETKQMEEWAATPIKNLEEFAVVSEASVSGTGWKLILRCEDELAHSVVMIDAVAHGEHKPQIEVFTDNKYFALTEFEVLDAKPVEDMFEVLSGHLPGINKKQERVSSEAVGGDTSTDELSELLSKIDVLDYQDRGSWIKILQASHHATGGSDEGLDVFKSWSQGDSAQYVEWAIDRDWNSLDASVEGGVTVATLIAEIPKGDRPQPSVSDDFQVVERDIDAEVSDRMRSLGGLLDDSVRNHAFIAKTFASDFKEVLRYVGEWNKWISYRDGVWSLDDSGVAVTQQLLDFLERLTERVPQGGDEKEYAKALSWVSTMSNATNTKGIIFQCKSQREFYVTIDDLEMKPHLLNLQNGTLNLRTMELQDHDPEDYIMQMCDVAYDAEALCPVWDKVVRDVFAGDQGLVSYVQTLLGYSLSGTTELEIFPVFYGDGCNGKSTIVQTVGRVLGTYTSHISSDLFNSKQQSHPTHIARLKGARVVPVAEMESDMELSESMVKRLTSQDDVEARRMYENPWTFTPSHTMLLCTNHKPRVKSSDDGIWRRLKLIPFEVDLRKLPGGVDVSIPNKIKSEHSGVLNWIIAGHAEYKANGVVDCEAVKQATDDYKEDEDVFSDFVKDYLYPVVGSHTPVDRVFSTYSMQGGRLGKHKFTAEMQRCGHPKVRVSVEGKRLVVFQNVTLMSGV